MADESQKPPIYYTTKEAVALSRIRPDVFAWIVHTSRIRPAMVGLRPVYTQETIDKVLKVFWQKDPEGRFLCREERKNGPYKKKNRTVASEN